MTAHPIITMAPAIAGLVAAACISGAATGDVFYGLDHTALGDAVLQTGPTGKLRVSNLGSSGKDGVSINLGGSQGVVYELGLPAQGPGPAPSATPNPGSPAGHSIWSRFTSQRVWQMMVPAAATCR